MTELKEQHMNAIHVEEPSWGGLCADITQGLPEFISSHQSQLYLNYKDLVMQAISNNSNNSSSMSHTIETTCFLNI